MKRLALLLAVCGCADPDPVPLQPEPDRPPEVVREAGVDRDVAPPDIGTPVDMGVDADPDPMDGAMVDQGPDAGPPGAAPGRNRVVVLSNRDDAWVAWIKNGELFAARLAEGAEAVEEPTRLADASMLDGPLLGYRLSGNRPWVLLNDGEAGMLRAHDLTGGSEPAPLGLYPPARVFLDGDALVMGRLAPDAPRLGWRLVGDRNELDPIVEDIHGYPLATSAARAMEGWVFGYGGPVCLDTTSATTPQAPWRCRGVAGARLVGSGNRLSWAGPTMAGLRMWQAMPAVAADPEGEDADGQALTLAAGGAIVAVLTPPPSGQLMHIDEADGTQALWWIQANRTRRQALGGAEDILGLSQVKSDTRLIGWSTDENRPVPLPAEFADGPAPPAFVPRGECASFGAETCGGADQNCDGAPQAGLCCRNNNSRLSTAVAGDAAFGLDWLAGFSDVGFLFLARIGTTALLVTHPEANDTGNAADERARWEGVHGIKLFSNRLARTVILAEVDEPGAEPPEGEPVPRVDRLLWFLGAAGSSDSAPPCADVVGLTMLDDTGRTRVWCTDGAVDIEAMAEMGDAVVYPGEAGLVRWFEPNALGDRDLILVARGEEHTLELWRVGADGSVTPEAEVALPLEVTLLTPEERVSPFRLPVQPGGPTARVEDGRLELLQPGSTWTAVPGTAWPIEARISNFEPVAVSVGFVADPSEDPDLVDVDYYIHSLQPDTHPWGQPYIPNRRSFIRRFEHQGIGFGAYSGAFQRPIFVFGNGEIRPGGGVVTVAASGIACEPPAE